jgi:protein involved in polysaccharide export with SLBB domain
VWEEKLRHSVQVFGEVHNPGSFTLAQGMKLSDLVFAAGGVTEKAYLKVAELTRYKVIDGEARVTTHMAIDLADALRDGTNDLVIHPFDVLTVRQLSNWREVERVKIEGEVRFPGVYPIEDGETLVQLIERAGGYTDRAYLPGSVFLREAVRKEQQKQMDDASAHMEASIILAEGSKKTLNDPSLIKQKERGLAVAKRVLEKAKEIQAQGRIVIELELLDRMKKSDFNLTLKDGDHLYIPKRPDQVLIVGQVSNTIAMLYRRGYALDNYLDDAGGLTRMGDESEIYVVKANGRVARSGGGWGRDVKIGPGDTIVVPEKLEQFNFLDSSLDWSRVMSQVAISIASMVAIGIL